MKQVEALNILKMGQNVFLTGQPGAGKTHTINEYVAWLQSHDIDPAITASTGISATHIGGMTIHSWAGIGIRNGLDERDLKKIAQTSYVTKRLKRTHVLIIDEVSMLSPQTFSMVDQVCRHIKNESEPFGGMQVVVVGDFFQLPPVVKKEETDESQMALVPEFSGRFAYDSPAWARAKFTTCYLTEQHRQDDHTFLQLLSAIRQNMFGALHLEQIKKRQKDEADVPANAPKLFSYNMDVVRVNNQILDTIEQPIKTFSMHSEGPEPLVLAIKKGCLSPESLGLKVGAQVMFTKNNPKEGFVNGTLGSIVAFASGTQEPIVQTRDGKTITVEPMDWMISENGKTLAKVSQLPLRLAWAITVHKSQGMSLDEAVMDLSSVFEYGQGYVALSRVRRFSGLHLLGFNKRAFLVDPEVLKKDAEFVRQSTQALKLLGKMPAQEIEKVTDQFVLRCGGKVGFGGAAAAAPAYNVKKIREKHASAYLPWDANQDTELEELYAQKLTIGEIALAFNRTKGSIRSRLIKRGLLES